MSAQHCAAVALIYGKAGVEQFTDAAVADPEVRRLRERVTIKADASLDKAACLLEIDGRTKRAELRPTMSDAELEAKFRSLAGAEAERVLEWLRGLEAAEKVRLPSALSRRRR